MKISLWNRVFIYLSGADFKTISFCPPDLIKRYSLLGVLVCIPAIFGFISSYYAVSLAFPGQTNTSIFATIWAFTILTIDRCIVAYNPEVYDEDDKSKPYIIWLTSFLKNFVPRIILSAVLGIIVAEPLCIGVFKDEIDEQISNEIRSEKLVKTNYLKTQITKSEGQIKDERDKWRQKMSATTDEISGKSISNKKGAGIIYRRKLQEEKIYETEFEKFERLKQNSIKKDSLEIEKINNEIEKNKARGLLGQIKSLNKVANANNELFYAIWLVRLLFIVIELIPLFLKSSLKKKSDAYVRICHQNNRIAINLNKQDEYNVIRNEMIAASNEHNKVLEQIIKQKNIDRAVKDFKFYFNMHEFTAKYYEKTRSTIDKIIDNEFLRIDLLNNLLESYQDFLAKTKEFYTNKNSDEN